VSPTSPLRRVNRCHICERPREPEDEEYEVAMRNGLYVPACWSCWMRWPDEHKLWPAKGFGHWPADSSEVVPRTVRLEDVVDDLRETA
jgi:hypothetical protein